MERRWWTLVAVAIGVFMLLLDITIVNVALPDIERELGASLTELQWVIDAYALSLAALLLTAGSLADLFGRRLVFAAGIVVFTVGSLLCGIAPSPLALTLSRAAQGIGGAAMFATALALLAATFQGRDRGVAFGVFGAVTGVAVAAGPVVGGALVSGLSWRWIFFVNIPIGVVALFVALTRIDESRDPNAGRPDWLGFVTFSGALGALVYGLIRSNTVGWGSPTVVWPLVASALLLAAFLLVELRQARPMLDLSLLRKPTFSGGLIAAFGISAALFSMLTYLVLYLQNLLGYTAIQTGVRFLALSGAIFVTAGIAGRLTTHVPAKLLIGPGFVAVGIGLLLMRGITTTSGWTHLLPGFVVAGIGAGFVNVPLASTAVGVVEQARAGMASGINSTFRQVGIATGIAALGSLFSSTLRDHVVRDLAGTPLAARATDLAHTIATGNARGAVAGVPPPLRGLLGRAAAEGFVAGLNRILLVAAILSFVVAACAFVLIRQRDFVTAGEGAPAEAGGVPA